MSNNINNNMPPVIFVTTPEQKINYKWDSQSEYLNENISVLTVDDVRMLKNDGIHIPQIISCGDVLLKLPYENWYIDARESENGFINASAQAIFEVARCLGATKIVYKQCDVAESKRTIDTNNKINFKKVDLTSNVKTEKEEKYRKLVCVTNEIEPINFTIEQFEIAKQYAEERNLVSNADVRSLINARDPRYGQPIKRKTVSFEVSSSLNKSLDIAFTLNIMKAFNIDSNTKATTEHRIDLSVEWDIVF